jgi:hypothetical protein
LLLSFKKEDSSFLKKRSKRLLISERCPKLLLSVGLAYSCLLGAVAVNFLPAPDADNL